MDLKPEELTRAIPNYTVLYCTVPYYAVVYRTYRTTPHRTLPYPSVPHRTLPYHTVLLYGTVGDCNTLYASLYCTILKGVLWPTCMLSSRRMVAVAPLVSQGASWADSAAGWAASARGSPKPRPCQRVGCGGFDLTGHGQDTWVVEEDLRLGRSTLECETSASIMRLGRFFFCGYCCSEA